MTLRFPSFGLLLVGCFIGCTQSSTSIDESIPPEVLTSYKAALNLTAEPDQVVSVLTARSLVAATDLGVPDHTSHGHAESGTAGHDQVTEAETEHGHEYLAGDDQSRGDHASLQHEDRVPDEHAHDNTDAHDHANDGDDADRKHAEEHEHDHADHEHAHDSHDHGGPSPEERGEHIVIVGQVGGAPGVERGSADFPFEKGKASFLIFDPSFESPHDEGHEHGDGHEHAEGQECHFCASKAQDAQALVQFLGSDGKPLPIDARELFGIEENDIVVIQGHAAVQAGLLTIQGEGLYVRQ